MSVGTIITGTVEAIETRDLTEHARSEGWILPEGWEVRADLVRDDDANYAGPREMGDCYDDEDDEAWFLDQWQFVIVSVWVQDGSGREWGRCNIGAVEHGELPGAGTVDGFDAVSDDDMIDEALADAVIELERFGRPIITRSV